MKIKIVFLSHRLIKLLWPVTAFCFLVIKVQSAEPIPREYYGAKLEPRDQVLHGAGQTNAEDVLSYIASLERHAPVIFMDYIKVKEAPGEFVNKLRRKLSKLPSIRAVQLGMSFVTREESGDRRHESYALDFARGKYDEEFMTLFTQLKEVGVPCYIRIGYECNGKHNGYDAVEYKEAFIHVTKLLRESKLNAATVWCVYPVQIESAMPFYPGNDWVDWWGIDLFTPEDIKESGPIVAAARQHRKPLMIAESTPTGVGVTKGEESWKAWFEPYFSLIRCNPGIKAFFYINWNWSKYPQWSKWGDARLQSNETVAKRYRDEMDSPLFQQGKE